MVHATMSALKALRRPQEVADLRGRQVHQIAPKAMLDAVAQAELAMAAKRVESGVDEAEA